MPNFDRTTEGQIQQRIEENSFYPTFGRVVRVYEHTEDDDYTNFEMDVRLLAERNVQHRRIPYQFRSSNDIDVPQVGDVVVVEYMDGAKKKPIAKNAVFTDEKRPPKTTAGSWIRRQPSTKTSDGLEGDLYIESFSKHDIPASAEDVSEVEPLGAMVRISKKQDGMEGGDNLPAQIKLEDDGENDTTNIEASTRQDSGNMSFEINTGEGVVSMTAEPDEIQHNIDRPDKLSSGTESERTEMKMELDMENGQLTLSGFADLMGVKLDLQEGTFKLLDAEGYGLVSEGGGDFKWHNESVTHTGEVYEDEL